MLTCKDNFATRETFEIFQCGKCNFSFTQDFPAESEIGRYYDSSEYISHTDTQKGIINRLYHLARVIALKTKSRLVTGNSTCSERKLLDVGCGTGYFLNRMKELKWDVVGIEQSLEVREQVKRKFAIEPFPSEYLFEIKKESFNAITMWHVLEHVEHLNETMSTLHNVLKDDGTLFIALPNKASSDAFHYASEWAAYDVPRHLWHFSPNDFTKLAKKHGFVLNTIKPMYFDAFYISMLSEKNKKTPLASLVGMLKGSFFFLCSLLNIKRCSSLVYVLRKQK